MWHDETRVSLAASWRSTNMRTPAVPLPSCALTLKRAHRRTRVRVRVVLDDGSEGWRWSRHAVPLKKFAARLAKADASGASAWLSNKSANFSKPPLGLGRTRKRKNKSSQPKAAEPVGKKRKLGDRKAP